MNCTHIDPNTRACDLNKVTRGRPYGVPQRALPALLLLGTLVQAACSKEESPPTRVVNNGQPRDNDAGMDPVDAGPQIVREPNAGRNVPAELKDQKCAVELDELYELSVIHRQPEAIQLAADVVQSRFGVSFIGPSEACIEAIFFAGLEGGSALGEPMVKTAFDPCSRIAHSALAHNGSRWLLGSVDAREGARDLWVQTFSDDGELGDAHRISDTSGEEREPALGMSSTGTLIAAWVERDALNDSSRLLVRALSDSGAPLNDAVTLEDATGVTFGSLSLSAIGPHVALGYRRTEVGADSQIIIDILDPSSAARIRDRWTLTTQAGAFGTVDLDGDETGGAAVYSMVDPPSYQLWVQTLGPDGLAAPVQSAGRTGGPSPASRIIGPPYRATDASVAKIPAGYALAYRALSGGLVESPQIRVHFLDRFGRDNGASSMALTSEVGGRTGIATGYDGRVMVAWNEASDEGDTTLIAARLPCIAENN